MPYQTDAGIKLPPQLRLRSCDIGLAQDHRQKQDNHRGRQGIDCGSWGVGHGVLP